MKKLVFENNSPPTRSAAETAARGISPSMKTKKLKVRAFKIKPYEYTLESGKVCVAKDDFVVGTIRKDGSFCGAVFNPISDGYEGSVTYTKAEFKKVRGQELFLREE